MTEGSLQTLLEQAIAAREQQQLARAVALCDRVLALDRRNALALDLRAQLAWEMGDTDRAIALLTQAVKAYPRSARMRTNLGRGFAREGRYREAVVQLDQALKLEPGHVPAIGLKADVFAKQNRYDRARRTLASFLDDGLGDGDPPPPEIGWTCLHVLIHDGDLDDAVRLGRRILENEPAPNDAVRQTYFELARAQERSGDHEGAFATAVRANAILAPPFNPAQAERSFDALIATFTRETLASVPRAAEAPAPPIFVFGMPRSGTTLVERVLHAHPAAHGIGENGILHTLIQGLPARLGGARPYPECVQDLTATHVEDLAASYRDQARHAAPRATRIIDKDLGNYYRLGLISIMLPNARLVHCRRSPLDTCLSCFMEPLTPGSHPYATDLRHLAAQYRQYERIMRHWHETLDTPILDLDYEALVADQANVSRQLVEFCGLPWDDRCLQFHKVKRADRTLSFDQVRRPVYSSSIGRAERFGSLLDPLREGLRA